MKTYGIKKTTVRCTITIPDCRARVQRLYDYGISFRLDEEIITDIDKITELITGIKSQGGEMIDKNEFIDDDDLLIKHSFTYELTV